MLKCRLSVILGAKKLKVAELSRATGVNKNTLYRLYNETATRIELDAVEKICTYLDIDVGELFFIEKR